MGLTDQVVAWLKPEQRPEWMTAEQYASLPEELIVRELRYRTGRAGFRVREVTLVTTLVDAELYPLVELAELYRKRWEVEGHLKAFEDHHEDGCLALRDGRRSEQGIADVRVGV